ncbi:MAG TPA: hypothetical protein DCG19_04460 [Cryomorphaceae bacterium]|nr:hypothetical protein [Owenweeksia sp.]MBF97823.1 hypothetical protein [Owenweeksia sp.]HAD96634.1 hypothetical protein [Cryomorphaceae bacterium]HBF21512.1 hypothetical protein [Cryomorphaceae bacterium]|tara:strand:- start:5663 stop:6787 length:1125 start_codon:yes stop_codon:yes gene_type:complete
MGASVKHSDTSLYQLWRAENGKHLPAILLLALGVPFLLTVASLVMGDFDAGFLEEFFFWILPIELFLIPCVIVNAIFFIRYFWDKPRNPEWKSLSLKILGTLVGSILATTVTESIVYLRGVEDDDYIQLGGKQLSPVLTNYIEYTVVALIVAIPIFIVQARRKAILFKLREREFEVQRLNEMKTKAELSALQAKINPHFLYNALNSILSLIRSQPEEAEKMVINLSRLFRYSLSTQERHEWTVEDEMEMVRTYLEIEKVRFSDKLEVKEEIEEAARHYSIPRFLIQPLIENAIKHGTSKVKHGKLTFEASRNANDLILRFYDNGPPFPENFAQGYGLQSTYEKLELLFKGQYDITFHNGENKYVQIHLKKEENA